MKQFAVFQRIWTMFQAEEEENSEDGNSKTIQSRFFQRIVLQEYLF